jgi:energy-coupling factor transporter ATP-binding protein EcfA2
VPDYACVDFVLRSEIPLPELIEVGAEAGRDIVEIRRGAVAPTGAGSLERNGDTAVLDLPDVARFRIEGGRSITVDIDAACSERNLRLFLLGSALGILIHQRGLFPLHANAVVMGGVAVAFTGQSGAGKSTLAAHFSAAGHTVLSDDVCVIGLDTAGRPIVYPGLPRVKLWADAAKLHGHDVGGLERIHDDMDKYQLGLPSSSDQAPVPLGAVIRLVRESEQPVGLRRLRGRAGVQVLMTETYRPQVVSTLGLQEAHFGHCVSVAARVAVLEWTRQWGHEVFQVEVERLIRQLGEAQILGAGPDV